MMGVTLLLAPEAKRLDEAMDKTQETQRLMPSISGINASQAKAVIPPGLLAVRPFHQKSLNLLRYLALVLYHSYHMPRQFQLHRAIHD